MLDFQTWALSWHITRRNWAVYRKDLISNLSPTVADPLFFLLSLGLGLGGLVTLVDGRNYLQYLAPGITISTALFTSFFESSYGFYVRMTYENIFQAMLATPIGVREIILGEFIWVALKGAAMAFGVALVLACVGLVPQWMQIGLLLGIGALVAIPCGAIGLLSSSWVSNISQFQAVYSFLIAPLFFFSGIFFPVEKMPQALQTVAYLFPLAHGVKLAQFAFWGELPLSQAAAHVGALLAQGSVLGLCAVRAVNKRLRG